MQVDQVGRQHVHAEQLLEGFGLMAECLVQPGRGVVHDGAQAVGVLLEQIDEGQDARFAGEIGRQADGTALPQFSNPRSLAAIADDHGLAAVQHRSAQCRPIRWLAPVIRMGRNACSCWPRRQKK